MVAVPDTVGETFSGLASGGSGRFFTPEATHQKRIRIVDSCGDVFSDPGATPGASTNLVQLIQSVGVPLPAPPMLRATFFRGASHESAALPAPPRRSSAKARHFIAPFPGHPECLHEFTTHGDALCHRVEHQLALEYSWTAPPTLSSTGREFLSADCRPRPESARRNPSLRRR